MRWRSVFLASGFLALLAWGAFGTRERARGKSLLPTFVPTPVAYTVSVPTLEPTRVAGYRLTTTAEAEQWMAAHLYPRGYAFMQRALGKWLVISDTQERLTFPHSSLPPRSRGASWLRLGEEWTIQESFTVEWDEAGRVVQMTLQRGTRGWNSLGGHMWVPPRMAQLERGLAGWNPREIVDDSLEAPIPVQVRETGTGYMLTRTAVYRPPVLRFGEYLVQAREDRWEYDRETGLLTRHTEILHLADGGEVLLVNMRLEYAVADALPSDMLPLYQQAVAQLEKMQEED